MPGKRLNMPFLDDPGTSRHLSLVTSGNLDLVMTTDLVPIPDISHGPHVQYEFFIPMTASPGFYVEDAVIDCQPGHIIAVNPGQPHGLKISFGGISFIMILISRSWMEELTLKIRGDSCPGFTAKAHKLHSSIIGLVSQLASAGKEAAAKDDHKISTLTEKLAVMLIRLYHPDTRDAEENRFKDVVALMHQYYHEPLSIQQMAAVAGMNNFYFIRCFKRHFSISPYQFLTGIRIGNAVKLLMETRLPVAEISEKCGFKSPSRFAAVFLKINGQTPGRYRRAALSQRRRGR